MKELEPVVVLSSIDWDTAWQRHQIFAAAFAAEGRDVYFVENTGFRNPAWKDLPRLWRRARNLVSPAAAAGSNRVPARVRVLSPRVLPPTWGLFRFLNARFFLPALRRELAAAGLRPGAACVVYVPTATTVELVRTLKPGVVLYDCASNFRGHPSAPADFARLERELLSLADQVVCDSDFLFEQKRPSTPASRRSTRECPRSSSACRSRAGRGTTSSTTGRGVPTSTSASSTRSSARASRRPCAASPSRAPPSSRRPSRGTRPSPARSSPRASRPTRASCCPTASTPSFSE
ncbi:MAG: hypothetical protein M0D55_17355 [Elusimicrobiota bacterium]|nr:MAG: hypothetical protein M0D55_17355 [Elusimicrobiota bacterium]